MQGRTDDQQIKTHSVRCSKGRSRGYSESFVAIAPTKKM
jgi:hypothetical protein